MITRIREVRKAKGLTLDEVGQRCEPAFKPDWSPERRFIGPFAKRFKE